MAQGLGSRARYDPEAYIHKRQLGSLRAALGPLTNWIHVRDWTKDLMRSLSIGLKGKVARSEIAGKTAVNIWSTAMQICEDAYQNDDDAIRCRNDNPADGVRDPKRGIKRGK